MAAIYGLADVRRCVLVALIVGTILVVINQGVGAFVQFPRQASVLGRMVLNYLVPFSVAGVSALMANRSRGRAATESSQRADVKTAEPVE